MSAADETTPLAYAAMGLEAVFALVGLAILIRVLVFRRGEGGSAPGLPRWGLPGVDFACYALSGIVGSILLSGLAGLVTKRVHMSDDAMTIVATAVMEAGFLTGIMAIHAFYVAHSDEARAPFLPRLALRSGVATFLVAMPLVFGTSYAWEFLLDKMGLPETKQELVGILEGTHSPLLRWFFILVATILVPVTEEAVFRGGLFRYMRDRSPRWVSIVMTSVIFGALHVSWSDHMNGLPSLLPLIVLACVFCVAYERTGQIGTSIVAHALFNLNMILLVFVGVGS